MFRPECNGTAVSCTQPAKPQPIRTLSSIICKSTGRHVAMLLRVLQNMPRWEFHAFCLCHAPCAGVRGSAFALVDGGPTHVGVMLAVGSVRTSAALRLCEDPWKSLPSGALAAAGLVSGRDSKGSPAESESRESAAEAVAVLPLTALLRATAGASGSMMSGVRALPGGCALIPARDSGGSGSARGHAHCAPCSIHGAYSGMHVIDACRMCTAWQTPCMPPQTGGWCGVRAHVLRGWSQSTTSEHGESRRGTARSAIRRC